MKTIVVGDLHGQFEIAEAVLERNQPVVFIGDYMDSFTRPAADQIKTVQVVTQAVKDGNATALFGNHELSYMYPEMRCSGYEETKRLMFQHLDVSMLQSYVQIEGFLISHAGVSNDLLDNLGLTLGEYLEAGNFNQIGRSRGGRSAVGGLFWCDWNYDFTPVPGTNQIVGHTRGSSIRQFQDTNNWCIDCLEDDPHPKVVEIEDGKLNVLELW